MAETVLRIENIVLIVLFVLVLVSLLVAFLRGLFRGWRYGTYNMAYMFILVVIGLACLTPLSNWLGSLNLSGMIGSSMTIGSGDGAITFNVTSLYGTLTEAVTQAMQKYSPSTSPTEIASLANALASSVVKLLVIFVEGLLIATVFNLIGLLLWHIAFKRIIPAIKRKESYKKGKLISAFQEVVVTAVVGAMMIFPLTAIVNSVSNGFQSSTTAEEREKIKASNATASLVVDAAETYNSSIFAKAFFSWNVNQDGQSFDQSLINWLTSSDYSDTKISFAKELQSITKIATLAVETGVLNQNMTTAEIEILVLQSEYTPRLISALAGSDIICGAVPFALEIATNLDAVKKYVANNFGIDYFDNDWAGTLKNLATILSDVQKSSALDSVSYNGEDGKIHYDITDQSISSLFSDENVARFDEVFGKLSPNSEDFNVLNKLLLAYIINQVANSTSSDSAIGIGDFFPELTSDNFAYDSELGCNIATTLPDSFASIDFGAELRSIYHTAAKLNKIDPSFLGLALSSSFSQKFDSADMKKMTSIVVDHIDEVSSSITGEASDGTITTDDNGFSANRDVLLDSTLIINALPKFFKLMETTINTSLGTSASVDAANEELFGASGSLKDQKTRLINGKKEISSTLKVLGDLAKTEEGKNILKNTDTLPGITFDPDGNLSYISKGVLKALSSGVKNLDSSKIASALLPAITDKYLAGENSPLASLSLPVNLNFKCDNLGTELSDLLDMYADCQDLISYINSFSSIFSGSSGDNKAATSRALKGLAPYLADSSEASAGGTHDSPLYVLLSSFSTSKILNPDTYESDGTTVKASNENYLAVINKVFSSFGEGYKATSLGSDTTEDVNVAIVSVMKTIADSDSISALISGGSTIDMSALSGIDFVELLSPLDDSSTLSTIFAKLLDDKVLPSLLGDSEMSDLSFANVNSWQKEGESLNALVKAAAEIGDLSNIDFINSDPNAVETIISALSSNPMFYKTDSSTTPATTTYLFSEFFYNRFVTSLDNDSLAFFVDRSSTGSTAKEKTTTLKADFLKLDEAGWDTESAVIGDILSDVQAMGGLASFGDTIDYDKVNATNIGKLLSALSSSSSIGRTLSYHAYEKIIKNLKTNGIVLGDLSADYGNCNLDYIWTSFDYASDSEKISKASDREKEFSCLSDLMAAVLGPHYGLLKEDPVTHKQTIDATSLSLNDVSGEYLLKPVLSALASSHVFNSLPTTIGSTTVEGSNPTAFEAELSHLIADSKIYGDPASDSTVNGKVLGYVLDTDKTYSRLEKDNQFDSRSALWTGNGGEIDTLSSLIDDAKSLNVDFANFSINSFFSPTMSDYDSETNRSKLETVLADANESVIFYHLLSTKIVEAVTDSAGSFAGYGITKDNINSAYLDEHSSLDVQKEITTLTYVIKGALSNDLEHADINSLSTPEMKLTVKEISASYVFNSLPEGTTSQLTAFETIMEKMLNDSKIYGTDDASKANVKSYVSAIDTDRVLSSDTTSKIAARLDIVNGSKWSSEIESEFATVAVAKDGDLDINNLDIVKYLTKNSEGADLTASEKEERRASLSAFLCSINESKLLYRSLSYQVNKAMTDGTFSGLDFSNSNTSYLDSYNDEGVKDELDNLSYIIQEATSVDFNNADIKTLSDASTKDLMFRMSGSYVFNTLQEGKVSTTLTSFEGAVKKMLSESTLYGAVDDLTVQAKINSYVAEIDSTRVLTSSSAAAIKTRLDYQSTTSPVSVWGKEVKSLIDTSDDVTASDLDLKNLDLPTYLSKDSDGNPLSATAKEEKRQNIENVLIDINISGLLYRSLSIQMKKAMTGGSYSGLNFDNANTSFLDSKADSSVQDEIKNLTYIMQEAVSTDFDNATIDTLRDTTTQDLLKRMSGSYVFDTLAVGSSFANTTFEGIFEKLISTAGIYNTDTDASDNFFYVRLIDGNRVVGSIGNRLDYDATGTNKSKWGQELDKLFEAAEDIKSADIDVTSLDLSSYFGSDATIAETKRAALDKALQSINACGILYRALPIKVNDALTSTSTSLGGIDTAKANTFYKGKGLSALPYDDNEITALTYIVYDASSTNVSTSSLSSLDADKTSDLLGRMADSNIFNSLSSSKRTELGEYGLTIFQSLIQSTLFESEISEVYYRATSPKDNVSTNSEAASYANYGTLAKGKAGYYSVKLFPEVGSDAYISLCAGASANPNVVAIIVGDRTGNDGYSLSSFISIMKTGTLADAIKNNKLTNIDSATLYKVLGILNKNKLLMDCVPNSIGNFVTGATYSGYDGFTFALSNPYFSYWLTSDGAMKDMTVANANYDTVYPDEEISNLSTLLKTLSDNQTAFNGLSGSSSIDSSVIGNVNDMLTGLYESYIFYKAGSYEGVKDGSNILLPNGVSSSSSDPANDLTIFEQAFYVLYDKSKLASRATSSVYDYLTYASNTNVTDINRYKWKLHDKISSLTTLDRASSALFAWSDEISAFSGADGFLNKALSSGFLSSGLNLPSGGSFDFTKMSAANLETFAFALNALTVTNDLVPYELGGLLTDTIKFSTYSTTSRTIAVGASTYDISGLGSITALSVVSSGTLTAEYSYDGTTYGAFDIADIASKKPFYVRLSSTGTITSLTLSYDTADFFLTQTTSNAFERQDSYGSSTASPLLKLTEFATAAKTPSGDYISFDDPSSAITTVVGMFDKVLNLINDPNGFYQRGFAEDYSSKRADPSFRSRAYVLYNVLNFSTTVSGISHSVNLGQYLKRDYSSPYMGIAEIFNNASYDADVESSYFKNCLAYATTADVIIGNDQPSISGMNQIHSKMAGLASDTTYSLGAELSSSYTSSSLFGRKIASGQLASLLSQVVAYANFGSYFTGTNPAAPTYTKNAVLASHSEIATSDTALLSFTDSLVGESSILSAYKNIVSFYKGFGASQYATDLAANPTGTSFPVSSSTKALFTDRDGSSFTSLDKQLFGYFYLGVEYDFFVARDFFHNSYVLLGWSAVNHPDPFASGWSYSSVGSTIATA